MEEEKELLISEINDINDERLLQYILTFVLDVKKVW